MEIIRKIQELNLSEYPENELRVLINQLGVIGCIKYTFHPGKNIFRGRTIDRDQSLLSKNEYTYPPHQFNTRYQRASKPHMNMFYGTFVPEIEMSKNDEDLKRARATGVVEARSELRNPETNIIQKIAFGRWIVTQNINLVAVLFDEQYRDRSCFSELMNKEYEKFLSENEEMKLSSVNVNDFLASEFSKENDGNDFNYLISSTFTEMVVSQGYDGVLFPSVQTGGIGFNVAITPQAADQKLDLRVAGECLVYKRKKQMVVDNLRGNTLYSNQTHFQFNEIDPRYHAGEDNCLAALGCKSIDELLNE